MELSTETIMEITLNAIGYLTAGLLSVVIYTMFRRKAVVVPEKVAVKEEKQILMAATTTAPETNIPRTVFIPLNENNDVSNSTTYARRNRGEVIRLARKMLNSGTSGEQVRQLLPISKGELSILITNN